MNDRLNDGAIAQLNTSGDCPPDIPPWQLIWFGLFYVWDFIYADAVGEGKTSWRTNTRFPLNAQAFYERWKCPKQTIGARFDTKTGGTTQYVMVDIDRGSPYHPYANQQALMEILEVLDSIGLCQHLRIRSSSSEGIHLYFPLPKPQLCIGLAAAIAQALKQAGFVPKNGELELFPNVRSAPKTMYQGHRLPLQVGSCVLDEQWKPSHQSIGQFIQDWNTISSLQNIELLEQAITDSKPGKQNRGSSKDAEEWRNRLEGTLMQGWTNQGQTNQILFEVCQYARVFKGMEPSDVEAWALETIHSLPGYEQFCQHQHEIAQRIKDTTKAVCQKYYPLRQPFQGVFNSV